MIPTTVSLFAFGNVTYACHERIQTRQSTFTSLKSKVLSGRVMIAADMNMTNRIIRPTVVTAPVDRLREDMRY